MLGRLALEAAPGELDGLADRLTVLHPWGSLLAAASGADPDGLRRLAGLCAPGAQVTIVLGGGELDGRGPQRVAYAYAAAGLDVDVREIGAAEVAGLGTAWGKRLARSDAERRFWRIAGLAAPVPTPGSAPRRGS